MAGQTVVLLELEVKERKKNIPLYIELQADTWPARPACWSRNNWPGSAESGSNYIKIHCKLHFCLVLYFLFISIIWLLDLQCIIKLGLRVPPKARGSQVEPFKIKSSSRSRRVDLKIMYTYHVVAKAWNFWDRMANNLGWLPLKLPRWVCFRRIKRSE